METKVCLDCGLEKDISEFAWRNKAAGKRQSYCRPCRKILDQKAWASGSRKDNNYINKAKRIAINKEYVWEVLVNSQCVDCNESDPIVLEFDHVKGEKVADVCQMIYDRCSLAKLKEEIEKCELVCANCHKRRTSFRANHWRYQKLELASLVFNG